MTELWKDIKGYEYKYQVSSHGRVKIKENRAMRMNMGELREYTQKETILKPSDNGLGYLKVGLTNLEGKRKSNNYVHRLVALHFLPNPEEKPQVNHIDGDTKNNHINNLEWNTEKENTRHAYEVLNRKNNTSGINPKAPVAQINPETDLIIKIFDSITDAYKETGISHISCVCRGERKTAGKFKWKYQ